MRKYRKVVKWVWKDKDDFIMVYVCFFIIHYALLLMSLFESNWRKDIIVGSLLVFALIIWTFILQIFFARINAEVHYLRKK